MAASGKSAERSVIGMRKWLLAAPSSERCAQHVGKYLRRRALGRRVERRPGTTATTARPSRARRVAAKHSATDCVGGQRKSARFDRPVPIDQRPSLAPRQTARGKKASPKDEMGWVRARPQNDTALRRRPNGSQRQRQSAKHRAAAIRTVHRGDQIERLAISADQQMLAIVYRDPIKPDATRRVRRVFSPARTTSPVRRLAPA
jgi:hypothetical protein